MIQTIHVDLLQDGNLKDGTVEKIHAILKTIYYVYVYNEAAVKRKTAGFKSLEGEFKLAQNPSVYINLRVAN